MQIHCIALTMINKFIALTISAIKAGLNLLLRREVVLSFKMSILINSVFRYTMQRT